MRPTLLTSVDTNKGVNHSLLQPGDVIPWVRGSFDAIMCPYCKSSQFEAQDPNGYFPSENFNIFRNAYMFPHQEGKDRTYNHLFALRGEDPEHNQPILSEFRERIEGGLRQLRNDIDNRERLYEMCSGFWLKDGKTHYCSIEEFYDSFSPIFEFAYNYWSQILSIIQAMIGHNNPDDYQGYFEKFRALHYTACEGESADIIEEYEGILKPGESVGYKYSYHSGSDKISLRVHGNIGPERLQDLDLRLGKMKVDRVLRGIEYERRLVEDAYRAQEYYNIHGHFPPDYSPPF